MPSRSRSYVFTLNNPTPADDALLASLQCRYLLYGREVGEQGTPHYQGFVYFESGKTRSAVRKLLPRAHWEDRRGPIEKAIQYCKKQDENPVERGIPPMTKAQKGALGKRAFAEAFEAAKEGRLDDIPPGMRIRYYNTFKKIREDYKKNPPPIPTLDHQWLYGPSGSGKSTKARTDNPGAYLKLPTKWWDNYDDEPVVIVDEWQPDHAHLVSHLKRWADHWSFRAERKGGSMVIRPHKIVVTSQYHPAYCGFSPADLEAILRRFDVIEIKKSE